MEAETSSAARNTTKGAPPIKATILAVIVVSAVSTLLSSNLLHLVVLIVGEKGDIPDVGWLMLLVGIPRMFAGAVPWAIGFVLIFGFAKSVFLERWVLYGFLWSLPSVLGWGVLAITQPRGLGASALQTVLSVAIFMLSAYLTKVIYSRTVS